MNWWSARSVRERRLLAIAGSLLALVLAWFLFVRPLMDARATADARLQAASTALAQARADAAAFNRGAASPQAEATGPLAPFLTQSATEQGFTNMAVTGNRPDQAAISSAQVRPANFFAWLGQLETRGIAVRSLTATAGANQTISIQATLERAGE